MASMVNESASMAFGKMSSLVSPFTSHFHVRE